MNKLAALTAAALITSRLSTGAYAAVPLNTVLSKRLASITALFEREGDGCAIARPKLVLDVRPSLSFGMYDDTENSLHITTWEMLPHDAHTSYAKKVGARSSSDAREIFEESTYKWVFTHELGHWWQRCKGKTHIDSYSREAGANRIALAYWRVTDPSLTRVFSKLFFTLEDKLPHTVPQGTDKMIYFNHNYDALGRNPPAYIWYQAAMIVDAYRELPPPSLKSALSHPVQVAPSANPSRTTPK